MEQLNLNATIEMEGNYLIWGEQFILNVLIQLEWDFVHLNLTFKLFNTYTRILLILFNKLWTFAIYVLAFHHRRLPLKIHLWLTEPLRPPNLLGRTINIAIANKKVIAGKSRHTQRTVLLQWQNIYCARNRHHNLVNLTKLHLFLHLIFIDWNYSDVIK